MKGLLNTPHWVAWRLEKVEGREKLAKIPYSAIHGYRASTVKPSDWTTYHTALSISQMQGANGIGFVFSDSDNYFFIDIDNALQPDSTWSQFALDVLAMFPSAYREVSQSGTGLHIICTTKSVPEGFKGTNRQDIGLELYYKDRFCATTLTGNGDADIDYTASVNELIRRYVVESAVSKDMANWSTSPCVEWDGPADDLALIKIALDSSSAATIFSNKASFRDLWECNVEKLSATYATDQPGKDFNGSSADAALVSHLAFYTGKDCARIERLWLMSPLGQRDKTQNREKYRQDTILSAVERCEAVYRSRPTTITQEMITALTPSPTVSPVGVPRYREVKPGEGAYNASHTANAATFALCYYPGNTIKFVQQQGYRFNGQVWERVSDEELEYQLITAMLHSEPKSDVISGTLKNLRRMFTRADSEPGTWEGRDITHFIVCQNGILDVHTGTLEAHNQAYFTTGILPYSYDPYARAPQWETFLNSTLEADQERIALLQEWLGYMLVGNYDYQKAMLLVGAPRSGKGTIGRILQELVGKESYAGITLEGLASDAVLETVIDKNVLFIGDAHSVSGNDRNRILDRFKSITGGDAIPVNRKYKGAWNGRLPGRITMATNNIPTFADESSALANRLLVLPFNVSFLNNEDPKLTEKLLAELPGICNWSLEGLKRLRVTGRFTEPQVSREERDEIIMQQVPLMGFVRDCCEEDPASNVPTKVLYNAYKMWKIQEGGSAMSHTAFTRSMRSMLRGKSMKKPIRQADGSAPQCFTGIRVKDMYNAASNNVVPFSAVAGSN